jgi:hypothetical protein
MNTSLGFFGWLREGVRRSIVLGFSDAIGEIGNRSADEDISPHLAAHLQESLIVDPGERTASLAGATASAPGARKRLGKSLEQLQQSGKAA